MPTKSFSLRLGYLVKVLLLEPGQWLPSLDSQDRPVFMLKEARTTPAFALERSSTSATILRRRLSWLAMFITRHLVGSTLWGGTNS